MSEQASAPPTRQQWMSVLAKAQPDRLLALWEAAERGEERRMTWLRAPEIGTAMVQGRAGGTGAAFNLGEVSVTRCSVQIDALVGAAYVQGRDKNKARVAALCDALLQSEVETANRIHTGIIAPLEADAEEKRTRTAAKADATKVEFYTLVRGEEA